MSFFESWKKTRLSLTGAESIATLDAMEEFFQGGTNWTQGAYNRPDGTKCLVGAANHVRISRLDEAKHFLRAAIAERVPGLTEIEGFNDTRQSYGEISDVIARAKQLATARQLPAPVSAARPWTLQLPAGARAAQLPPPADTPLALPFRPAVAVEQTSPQRRAVAAKPARVRARRSLADWLD